MAYGGLGTVSSPPLTGGYKGLSTPVAPSTTPQPLSGLGYVAAPFVSAVKGVKEGYQAVPATPKNGKFLGGFNDAAHATIDAFSNAIKQGSQNLSTQVDVMQKQLAEKGTLGLEGDVALGKTIVGSIGTVFGAALSPLQGLATVPGVGHAVDIVNKLFGAIGEGSGQGAVQVLNETPMSQAHKDILAPLVHDAASLAGQIVAGKLGGDSIGLLKDKIVAITDNLHNQLQGAKTAIQTAPVKTLPVSGESTSQDVRFSNKYEQPSTIQMGPKGYQGLPVAETSPAEVTKAPPGYSYEPIKEETSTDPVSSKVEYTVSNPETGAIEVIKGNNSFGLSKIEQAHPEVLPVLSDAIKSAKVVDRLPHMTILEGETTKGTVRLVVDHQLGTTEGIVPKTFLNNAYFKNVPRRGIEPPTQGSSDLRSTIELPRQDNGSTLSPDLQPSLKGKTITKVASDINATLVKQGFDALSPEEQSKYTAQSYKEQETAIASLLDAKPEDVKAMATGEKTVPSKLNGQILFNTVEALATKEGDGELLMRLANSPLGKKLSEAGQTLGGHGFNDNLNSVVKAIREIQTAREALAEKVKPEATERIKDSIRKENTKQTWGDFIKTLQC